MLVRILRSSHLISRLIASIPNLFAQLLVVFLVTVSAFYSFTNSLSQFNLYQTLFFYLFVSKFDSIQKFSFRHLIHLTLNHHNIIDSCTHHNIHISFFKLFESRVYNQFSVYTSHTNLRDRTVERYIRNSQSSRSSQSCQCIRHILTVG